MPIADLVTRFRSRLSTYTPVVNLLEDFITGNPTGQAATNRAAHVVEQGVIGGERNTGSLSGNNWEAVHEETNWTRFAPNATTEQVVSAVPVFLYGFIGVTGTGTLTLRDSTGTPAGTTSPFPAFTLSVGGRVEFPAVRFENGLTAQLGTATDVVTFFTRPIGG